MYPATLLRFLILLTLVLLSHVLPAQHPDLARVADSVRKVCAALREPGPFPPKSIPYEIDSMLLAVDTLRVDTNMPIRLCFLGRRYVFTGAYDRTVACARMARRLSALQGYATGYGTACLIESIGHRESGNINAALQSALQALPVFEFSGDAERITHTYSTIANIYSNQQDYAHALEYNFKGLRHLETAPLPESVQKSFNLYHNIGSCYLPLAQYDSALYYLNLSEQRFIESEEPRGLCMTLAELARCHLRMQHPEQAQMYLDSCLRLSSRLGFTASLATAYMVKGELELRGGKARAAMASLKDALQFFDGSHDLTERRQTLGLLAAACAAGGDYAQAYGYQQDYSRVSDSLHQKEKLRAFSDLKTDYAVEKREGEMRAEALLEQRKRDAADAQQRLILYSISGALVLVILLVLVLYMAFRKSNRDKATIEAQRAQLQASLLEREALLREIHHRVKNNLQVISGLLSLQSGQSESEELKGIMREGQSRVKSMALIHQMLYQHENLSSIPFQQYLESLVRELRGTYGRGAQDVQVRVEAGTVSFDVDIAIPLGLIVNELVTNAFKYAVPAGGTGIRIAVQQTGPQQYALDVQDNGPGLPEGYRIGETRSLGLRLVQLLCRQLRGDLTVHNAGGAQFHIQFRTDAKTAET